ncbi:hypothetical protein ACOSP7_021994 [Xanthoceras sorbifolium]
MLRSGQPSTPVTASPLGTPIVKDSSKQVNKKQKVVEGSSPRVEFSLTAGASAFKGYKAMVEEADQFVLPHNGQLLRDSGGVKHDRSAVRERDERLEELEK